MNTALRILLVEDDPMLRLGASAVLMDAGYAVLEAADADEAIALRETEPDIRLMISDIQMPGSLDGVKLAHAVRRRWPLARPPRRPPPPSPRGRAMGPRSPTRRRSA